MMAYLGTWRMSVVALQLHVVLRAPETLTTATEYPVVDVPGLGRMQGVDEGSGLSSFYGVPFAQPPTGELRWKPPQPHKGWGSKTLNATVYGACCLQGRLGEAAHGGWQLGSSLNVGWGEVQSEDCLFLNAAAPTATLGNMDSKISVMVWIHGGGYQEGDPSEYPIESLATASRGSVIVVSVSYRLSVFGFLGGHEVAASTGGGGSGNFGIQDQRAAIKWCKDNIAAFGGNGDDITIFGESAGGNSVFNHLAQPASFPLYQKAIIESGLNDEGARTSENAEAGYQALLKAVGCSGLDCLRAKNASELLAANTQVPPSIAGHPGEPGGCCSGPTVDGVSLTASPAALIAAKQYHSAARVLIGSNRDEFAFMTMPMMPAQLNDMMMQFTVQSNPPWLYGKNQTLYQEFLQVYDPANYSYPLLATEPNANFSLDYWKTIRSATDTIPGLGACAVRWMDRMLVAGGTPAVYSYLFAHPPHGQPEFGKFGTPVFASHTAELGFVFNKPRGSPSASPFTSEEAALADTVSRYRYTFAATGDPNPKPAETINETTTAAVHREVGIGVPPVWPQWTPEGDTIMRLETVSEGGVRAQTGLRKAACDWQDKIACSPPTADCRARPSIP